MEEGAIYKQVIVQIKSEVDASWEKTWSRLTSQTDNVARSMEQRIGAVIQNLDNALKRLESASARVGVGAAAGAGGVGGAPIGGGGGGGGFSPPGPIAGGGTALGFGGGGVAGFGMGGMAGAMLNSPMMQAGAAAASSLGLGGAFHAYQSQLAGQIAAAQYHTGTAWPASMYGAGHFSQLAASLPDEFYGIPRNSLPQVNGRAASSPTNPLVGLGAYAPGPGPTLPQRRPQRGLPFDRERLIGMGIGLASGNWSSVASSAGTLAGTLAGGMYGPWGAAIGGGIGGFVGAGADSAISGVYGALNPSDDMEGLSWFQRNLYGSVGDDYLIGAIAGARDNGLAGGRLNGYSGDLGFGGVSRARSALSMQQRATALAGMERATGLSVAETRGSGAINRAMLSSDGTAKGDLAAVRTAIGGAGNDQQRIQLRQQELQLTRQISQESIRGSEQTIRNLEREKSHLEDTLKLRQRQTGAAGAAFGYAEKGDQQAALRAAEKFAAGQGATISRSEMEAYEQLALPYQTEQGRKWYEQEGQRRGGGGRTRLEELLGVQGELGGLQKKVTDVTGKITTEQKVIVELKQSQEEFEKAAKPVLDTLYKTYEESLVQVLQDKLRDFKIELAHEASRKANQGGRKGMNHN